MVQKSKESSHKKKISNNVASLNKTKNKQKNTKRSDKNILELSNKKIKYSNISEFDNDDVSVTTKSELSNDTVLDDNICYKTGDWVYCEKEPDQPYVIRKIEKFNKQTDGTLTANLRCAFRRNDISPTLLGILEKRYSQYFTSIQSTLSFSSLIPISNNINSNKLNESDDSLNDQLSTASSTSTDQSILNLSSQQIHQLKHHELFYSNYTEYDVPVSLIRGKLELNLFMSDISSFNDYVNSKCKNRFFYQMTYDPNQKMLSADYRQVRIGSKFQADIPDLLSSKRKDNNFNMETLECDFPIASQLSELSLKRYINKIINKTMELNRIYCENGEINLSKDLIMYKALIHLSKSNFDTSKSFNTYDFKLNNKNIWTKFDIFNFERGLEKLGKDFFQIKKEWLPNKQTSDIVNFYYNVYKLSQEKIDKRNEKRSIKSDKLVEIQLPKPNYFVQTLHDIHSETEEETFGTDGEITKNERIIDSDLNEKLCISCQKLKKLTSFNRLVNPDPTNEFNNYHSNMLNKQNDCTFETLSKINESISDNNNKKSLLIEKNSKQYLTNYKTGLINDNKLSLEQLKHDKEIISDQIKFKIEKLCNKCWIYWKKYGEFKYTYYYDACMNKNMNLERPRPEKRQDRLNALNYKCYVDNCLKEFKLKNEFIKHSLVSHCLLVKMALLNAKSKYQVLHNFVLQTTPFTKALRNVYGKANPKYFKNLGRHPFKELADKMLIMDEWNKQSSLNVRPLLFKKTKKIASNTLENIVTKLRKRSKENLYHAKNLELKKSFMENLLTTTVNQTVTRPLTPLSPSLQSNMDFYDNILDNTNILDYSDSIIKSNSKTDSSSSSSTSSTGLLTIKCFFNDQSQKQSIVSSSSSSTLKSLITKKRSNYLSKKYKSINSYLDLNDCLSPSPSPTPSSSSCGHNYNNVSSLNPVLSKGNDLLNLSKNSSADTHQEKDHKLTKINLIDLINNNQNNLDESLCLEDWYYKSDSKLRKNRFKKITKNNLKRLARAPFKYAVEKLENKTNQEAKKRTYKKKLKKINDSNKNKLIKVKNSLRKSKKGEKSQKINHK